MDKTYDPSNIEQRLYAHWESQGWFSPNHTGEPYCIMIPPPNVTGNLHMGHAFQHTLMDALIRYHGMCGKDTLWQPGSDHAGIATQMVVERQLAAQGVDRITLGRDAFIDKVWEWKAQSGGIISQQMRRLGDAVDWSRERFTMDAGLSAAVVEIFVRLYRDDLIYRGKRLVNWDPVLHTAISDLEVENREEQGSLWHLRYPLAEGATTLDGQTFLVVATTRPETLLGDTAVAVHPEDSRYQHLVGKTVTLPLVGRALPIVADTSVDPEFGTGAVKITPAHDFNDYQLGKRHQAPLINIFDASAQVLTAGEAFYYDGTARTDLNTEFPKFVHGLDRFTARQAIVTELQQQGLLAEVAAHSLKAPYGDRSGVIVEPWLTDQWYVRTEPLAKPAIAAVESGNIRFVPKQWENTYFAWLRDIEDWCISRQLWWGHQIPAWYDTEGNIYVGRDEKEVRQHYKLPHEVALARDPDVLDTWFSSALWTFSTLGWPEQTPDLKRFHPTQVLVTGFDIIFFWVARMIMFTLYVMRDENGVPEVPFQDVYVTGLIRDEFGQKMSKSKGNVIDPLDLIDGISVDDLVLKRTSGLMQPQQAADIEQATRGAFPTGFPTSGTDALRFTLTSLATTGRDVKFDLKRLAGYRNFCNKLWNAARFVRMQTLDEHNQPLFDTQQALPDLNQLTGVERWMWSRLQHTSALLNQHLTQYRFDLASQALYDFVWNEYCDWFVELSKLQLRDEALTAAQKAQIRHSLVHILEHILRLAHPFMPFITEEIWLSMRPLTECLEPTITQRPYPQAQAERVDAEAEADVCWIQDLVTAVRTLRAENNIAPSKLVDLILQTDDGAPKARVAAYESLLKGLTRCASVQWLSQAEPTPAAATQVLGEVRVLIPLAGLVDVGAELSRLDKQIEKQQMLQLQLENKLNNERFVAQAPAEVVAQTREKWAELGAQTQLLQQQRAQLAESI